MPIAFLHLDEPAHRKAPHSRQMAADSGTVLHTQHLRRTESLYSVSNRSGSVHSRTVQPCANSVAMRHSPVSPANSCPVASSGTLQRLNTART